MPFQKRIFGHMTSLIGENVITAYSENIPGLLHTPAKYEKNPPYGCEAIAKRKCRSGRSGKSSRASGVASPINKQASLVGRLILLNRASTYMEFDCITQVPTEASYLL